MSNILVDISDMNILINASNLKAGGGLQVADSICRELYRFSQHKFIVVLSSFFGDTESSLMSCQNISTYIYDVRNSIETILLGRDRFLDDLVKEKKIDAVLTIFGPSRWEPRCLHLCGFAKAFHVIPESPYYTKMSRMELFIKKLENKIYEYFFQRTTNHFFTENPYITNRLSLLFNSSKVYTVTNYYNQVFDKPELWKEKKLSAFDGVSILTVSNSYPHKNLEITADITRLFIKSWPNFKFRFVITINKKEFHADLKGIEDHFEFLGKVDISECPFLYKQCDIVFQPSLIECFTAAYPEAMRMERPIVTTDLEFARGLCDDAASYYSAVDAQDAAKTIYRVATDKVFSSKLIDNGKKRLNKYDTYEKRADKLISILEQIVNEKENL